MKNAKKGLYVYCIGEEEGLREAVAAGLPESIETGEAFTVAAASGFAALCSAVPLASYGEGVLERRLADPAWTAERALRHAALLERISSKTTVAPLRMGTVFLTEQRVKHMLAERADSLRGRLKTLKGCDEWSVVLHCDRRRLRESVDDLSPSLKGMKDAAQTASRGRAYLMEKKRESLRAEESRAVVRKTVREAQQALAKTSVATIPPEPGLRPGSGVEEVAGKLTFLVSRKSFPRFRQTAAAFAEAHRNMGIRIELVGPLPAYNFVDDAFGETLDRSR